ncbi:hypothetical protein D3C85_1361310 [compost metagenome]
MARTCGTCCNNGNTNRATPTPSSSTTSAWASFSALRKRMRNHGRNSRQKCRPFSARDGICHSRVEPSPQLSPLPSSSQLLIRASAPACDSTCRCTLWMDMYGVPPAHIILTMFMGPLPLMSGGTATSLNKNGDTHADHGTRHQRQCQLYPITSTTFGLALHFDGQGHVIIKSGVQYCVTFQGDRCQT